LAAPVSARLTAAEGRRFGLTLGGAFVALGAVLWWRGRAAAPLVTALGLVLVTAALLLPTHLAPVQRAWMALGAAISRITTPIFLGIVYFGAILPIGLLLRARGGNPLTRQRAPTTCWVPRPARARSPSDMERQF
jgi:hypothetical protein